MAMSEARVSDLKHTPGRGYGPNLVQVVAANVRAEAVRRGYNQTTLAEALGVAQPTVGRKWWGNRAWSLEDLETLSAVLRVPVSHLIARPEGVEPPTLRSGTRSGP